jgi:uncharacterized membrane protein YedE/YeeE
MRFAVLLSAAMLLMIIEVFAGRAGGKRYASGQFFYDPPADAMCLGSGIFGIGMVAGAASTCNCRKSPKIS